MQREMLWPDTHTRQYSSHDGPSIEEVQQAFFTHDRREGEAVTVKLPVNGSGMIEMTVDYLGWGPINGLFFSGTVQDDCLPKFFEHRVYVQLTEDRRCQIRFVG